MNINCRRKEIRRAGRYLVGVRHYPQEQKQIDSLPKHAQHIFTKVHANAVVQYKNPAKRRGGKRQSAEEVAHKAAWAAVKNKYRKKGDKWLRKE